MEQVKKGNTMLLAQFNRVDSKKRISHFPDSRVRPKRNKKMNNTVSQFVSFRQTLRRIVPTRHNEEKWSDGNNDLQRNFLGALSSGFRPSKKNFLFSDHL